MFILKPNNTRDKPPNKNTKIKTKQYTRINADFPLRWSGSQRSRPPAHTVFYVLLDVLIQPPLCFTPPTAAPPYPLWLRLTCCGHFIESIELSNTVQSSAITCFIQCIAVLKGDSDNMLCKRIIEKKILWLWINFFLFVVVGSKINVLFTSV